MMSEARLAVPDVNVLLALTNPSHVFHHESHQWLADVARFATTPVTESGLLRMLLNPAVTGQVVTPEQALAVLAGIRADSRAGFLVDDSSLADANVDTTGLAQARLYSGSISSRSAASHSGPPARHPRLCRRQAG